MRREIVVIGSVNADLVVRVPSFPSPGETVTGSSLEVFPGGKGANQACAAARLGARVHMVGRIGDDSNGRFLAGQLASAGVDTSRLVTDSTTPTGTALIAVDDGGENEIVVIPGANGRVSVEDVESCWGLIESAGIVLLQLEVPLPAVEAAARAAREAGAAVILDPAPARADALSLLPLVEYVTPNETELAALAGDRGTPEDLLAIGARNVISKLGEAGARLVSGVEEHAWAGLDVEPVDTTAAGDVWNGAFAAGLAEGMEVARAGRFANAAAALSVTRPGAQPSMPTRQQVEAFLDGRRG